MMGPDAAAGGGRPLEAVPRRAGDGNGGLGTRRHSRGEEAGESTSARPREEGGGR